VCEFVRACRDRRLTVYVVSHKTEFAGYDDTRTNLRQAALDWMRAQRFFDADGLGLGPADVFFESTRGEKIERIRSLGCTHFIDDLEEVLVDPAFPARIVKILYAPDAVLDAAGEIKVMPSWPDIHDYFFTAAP
jgi:hypothetical protein